MSDVLFYAGTFDCCCGCSMDNENHSGYFCCATNLPVLAANCLTRGLSDIEACICKRCLDLQATSSQSSSSSSNISSLESSFQQTQQELSFRSPVSVW